MHHKNGLMVTLFEGPNVVVTLWTILESLTKRTCFYSLVIQKQTPTTYSKNLEVFNCFFTLLVCTDFYLEERESNFFQ